MLTEQASNISRGAYPLSHSNDDVNGNTNDDAYLKSNNDRTTSRKPSRRYKILLLASILTYGLSSSSFASAFTNTDIRIKNNAFALHPKSKQNYFHHHHPQRNSPLFNNIIIPKRSHHHLHQKSSNKQLQMSSIDRDPDENNLLNEIKSWFNSKLPDPPEDQLTLSGDIGSIFLYTFIDHAVNDLFNEYLNGPEITGSRSASAAIESSFALTSDISNPFSQGPLTGNCFPVWFDSMSSAPFGNIPLSSALPIAHQIHYAPAIEAAGMASVLLCTCWMISGYFTGAFQFKNTLSCSTNRTIIVTAQTWFFTTLLMFAIAYGSDYLVGSFDSLHKSVGLTIADEDYILDSLTVLLMWRFIISTFLGSGEDSK